MEPTLELIIFGTVQGVGLRAATIAIANRLGINGTVTNQSDGTVLVLAQGSHEALNQFVQDIKAGPTPAAEIGGIDLRFTKHDQLTGFKAI